MKKEITFGLSKILILPAFLNSIILLMPTEAISNPTSKGKQDQIKEIESKLSSEKEKLKAFDFQEKGLLAQLSDLEQKVTNARLSVSELEKKIRLDKIEMEKLRMRLEKSKQSLMDAEIQVLKRLVALYKYSRKGYVKMLANVQDLDQFWQRVTYLKAIMEKDRDMLEELTKQKLIHEREISRIREQLDEKEASSSENKIRLSSLKKDLEKKVIRLMKIHKEKEFYETAVKELELAAIDMKQTLLNIEKKDTYKTLRSSRFADSKGQLPFPLKGKVIKADKLFGSSSQNLSKGIFIEGSSDAKVKAVFPGRVDFSGRLKGYGEIIIINHGSRFFTISGHFSHRQKREGDVVEGGEVIGFVRPSGSQKESRLYFEIRKAGKSLDPLKWLKYH
ncbi:MAG: peptidoglycan DD-metalloendopeptidase family protein [Desulfobacteraceae bacterium]|nr:MAG: peptidoglycan DD-metalloendopeptidase family protein [Desulfobacteraceae bacterium]